MHKDDRHKKHLSGSSKPAQWTSTPDLANEAETSTAVTVNLKLPKRRSTGPIPSLDTGQGNGMYLPRKIFLNSVKNNFGLTELPKSVLNIQQKAASLSHVYTTEPILI